jgi:WD40 repeat protein
MMAGYASGTWQAHDDPINAVAWSRDGKHIASVALDGKMVIWAASSGEAVCGFEHPTPLVSAAWMGDTSHLLTISETNQVIIRSINADN